MSAQGHVVDGFELLDELGRGGMGAVYRARELSSGRQVAFKIVLGTQSPDRLARLEREGSLTASLNHPGIVRIHRAGNHQGRPYLAYELVEGVRAWDDVLRTLGLEQRVALIRDVARALGAAHSAGVVHRDVKPDNLLVGADGRVRVADFGLAIAQDVERLTQTGAFVGTPHYMAPECFERRGREIGPTVDVWSVGVLLYVALTGQLPFQGDTLVALVTALNTATPTRPRSIDSEVSADLEAVCLQALAQNPADRYANGDALADDLERVLAGEPVVARRVSSLRRVARWAPVALLPFAAGVGLALAWAYQPEPSAGPRAPGEAVARGTEPRDDAGEEDEEDDDEWVEVEPQRSGAPTDDVTALKNAGVAVGEAVTASDASVVADTLRTSVKNVITGSEHEDTPEGRAQAAYHRARLFRKVNPVEALAHYTAAANLGHSDATYEVALAYAGGKGCSPDAAEGFAWALKAAELGNADAMQTTAEWLHAGKGCTQDRKAAYEWWLKAAELGKRPSMVHVAREFRRGKYLQLNAKEAQFWKDAAMAKKAHWPAKLDEPLQD